jgi:rsbT antagonist protein RsbS
LKIEKFLVASIQLSLDDRSVVQFQGDLLEKVIDTGANGVVVDITAVDVVDSFMARSLNDIAIAVHLLGAQTVIVGMQPAVAVTLVEMGLTIPSAVTALDLERGLEMLRGILESGGKTRPVGGHSADEPAIGEKKDGDHERSQA